MKLKTILTEDVSQHEVAEWFHTYSNVDHPWHGIIEVKDGLVYFNEPMSLVLSCQEIKYKIAPGQVKELVAENLSTLKNMPELKIANLGGCKITVIDHPITCSDRLNLAKNELQTLKNIHKLVKCKTITVWNNPIKDGFLDLLKIPGIEEIDDGEYGELMKVYSRQHEALKIVSKYVGKGKLGIIDAQEELTDNDLEEFE